MKYFILLVICSQNIFFSQNKKCNYIKDYYPIIYEAELNYLKGNDDVAFDLFKKAECNCKLLNQSDILESVRYAELLGRRGNYNKAFHYLNQVVRNGFKFKFLENNPKLEFLQSHEKWNLLKLNSNNFEQSFDESINKKLRSKIISLVARDQELRQIDDRNSEENKFLKSQDSLNFLEIKEIFETYGYPTSSIVGHSSIDENVDIRFMLMHFIEVEYLEAKLLEFVQQGKCPPYVLGFFVDSNDRIEDKGFTYGVYNNVDSTEIKNFQFVDERRKAIGLRNYQVEKDRYQLLIEYLNTN